MRTTNRFAVGTRIGDYVIERELSEGTQGHTYEATHVVLPRRVRLTVMLPTFVGLRPVAMKLMREACILEALRHPGVPRVFETGVLIEQRTQSPWVASEIVEGTTIESQLASRRLSIREVLELVRDTAEILASTHARGVAHRGVRPAALVRPRDTRGFPLCLTHWNDARVPSSRDDKDHMFAEDIFALGLVADLALAGRTVPERLAALIDDMLAPNPMSRPSAAQVAARASELCDAEPRPLAVPASLDVIEISRARPRMRWTPATGIVRHTRVPAGAVAIGAVMTKAR